MATSKRVWAPGMMYHITARGNRKEIIFREEEDFYSYLAVVKEALQYYKDENYELICYCLMSNHIHMILKCNKKEPSFIMRRINSRYAKYFNIKYSYVGHLFQERYYAEVITNINHLIETSRYIHRNPVKANIVKFPEQYKWSSYKVYMRYDKFINHPVKQSVVQPADQYKESKFNLTNYINVDTKQRKKVYKKAIGLEDEDLCVEAVMQYFSSVKKYKDYVYEKEKEEKSM